MNVTDDRLDTPLDAADTPEFDDSGIGLGLLGDDARVTREATEKRSTMHRAPLLLQQLNDMEGTEIAI